MTNPAEKIEGLFTKRARAKGVKNAYLLVHSDKFKLHLNLAEGKTGQIPASPQQQYFIASIGKLFTAVTMARLVEEGKLKFSSPVMDFLEEDLLAGLHVYKGRDYTGNITLGQLLNHTSGIMDYFSDKPKGYQPLPGPNLSGASAFLDSPGGHPLVQGPPEDPLPPGQGIPLL